MTRTTTTRDTGTRRAPEGFEPGSTITRRSIVRPASYNAEARTVEAVFSTGARVRRFGAYEELDMSAAAVDLSRALAGTVPLLDSHRSDSVDNAIGWVIAARLESGELVGVLQFADTPRGREIEARVAAGELRSISIGYRVDQWTIVTNGDPDAEVWRATRWALLEVSLVAVPADPAAGVRSQPTTSDQEIDDMRRNAQPASADAPVETRAATTPVVASPAPAATAAPAAQPDPAVRAAPAPAVAAIDDAAVRAAVAAERNRVADITSVGTRAGLDDAVIRSAITDGTSVEVFRTRAFDHLAGAAEATRTSSAHVVRDETETRRAAMQEALGHRLSPAPLTGQRAEPSAAARAYMDLSIVEIAAERIGARRVPTSFAGREDILQRAFHTTSDFPLIFGGALNQALAARYHQATPTFRRLGRQRTYVDFRDHHAIRVGDFPDLQPVNPEGGEIKAGTFGESKEKTAVKAYGVRVGFSRQMLVNDSLNAIAQVLNDRGAAVARFEDRTFYAMAFSGAGGNGPQLGETGRQVWNATDKTLGTGSAITIASLSEGRAALRKRKTLDGHDMELAASLIVVGPDKETEAQQLIAPVQAQQAGNVNPFSGTLSIVTTAKVVGNGWYLFADAGEAPVFEWGLLEGYTAPRIRIDNPFGVQGVETSLEHDFGCGAIDWRGTWKNPGNA